MNLLQSFKFKGFTINLFGIAGRSGYKLTIVGPNGYFYKSDSLTMPNISSILFEHVRNLERVRLSIAEGEAA